MVHNGSATPAPGCGIGLATLAAERGISKDAARRLVKAGKVSAHQVPGDHGPEWCVHPDETVTSDDRSRHGGARDAPGLRNGPATVAPDPDLAVLVTLVGRLQVENRQLAEAATVWQERARMLADQLALAAPSQSSLGASGEPQSVEPTTGQDTPTPLSRRLALWRWLVLVLVVAVTTMAVLLAWPR